MRPFCSCCACHRTPGLPSTTPTVPICELENAGYQNTMIDILEILAGLGVQTAALPPSPSFARPWATAAKAQAPTYMPAPPAPPLPIEPVRTADGGIAARGDPGAVFSSWDYPMEARIARAEGVVTVRYVIGVDGRVHDCIVVASSGRDDLDARTCRLLVTRFRAIPARDAAGNPRPETQERRVAWRDPPPVPTPQPPPPR